MSRAVFDKIVKTNCEKQGIDDIYYRNLEMYTAEVKDTIEKVKLDSSKYGMLGESIISSLNQCYDAIHIVQEDCYVIMGGKRFPATKEQIRLLKALVIEQVNKNEEYSFVVYQVFIRFLKQIVTGNITYDFTEETDSWTSMQKVVFDAFTEYIKKKASSPYTLTIC